MSLFGRTPQRAPGEANLQAYGVEPRRATGRRGAVTVDNSSAMRHSAVWACTTLRRDLISTFPIDVYRDVEPGVRVTVKKSPFMRQPGGPGWGMRRWLSASQFDLDRTGNCIGLITEVDSLGLPARIELQDINKCKVIRRRNTNELIYRIDHIEYAASKVWHEIMNPVAGLDVGLSPIAYAAWSIGEYLSIQDFALDWFGGSGVPKARLRNTAKKLNQVEAGVMKDQWRASVQNGSLFVTGNDWEYDMMQATSMGMEWLEGKRFGLADICRYFRCPADLIEAAISAPGSLTYQTTLSRNLQFLVMQLNPTVIQREEALSDTQPRPRYVKMNTAALLRMDPMQQAQVIHQRITDRTITPTEARELYDLSPLTQAQIDEFTTLFGAPRQAAPDKPSLDATLRWAPNGDEVIRATATVDQPEAIEWKVPA